eukprot:gene20361-24387_t
MGGAVLGGLIAGPFGAIWGASVGAGFGGNARAEREAEAAQEAEMKRLGLTPEIAAMAAEAVRDLKEAELALELSIRAFDSQRALCVGLERAAQEAYAAAEEAMAAGKEEDAKASLLRRRALTDELEAATADLSTAERRASRDQDNIKIISQRATQIEEIVKANREGRELPASDYSALYNNPARTDRWDATVQDYEEEDPLMKQFRKLEEDDKRRGS